MIQLCQISHIFNIIQKKKKKKIGLQSEGFSFS